MWQINEFLKNQEGSVMISHLHKQTKGGEIYVIDQWTKLKPRRKCYDLTFTQNNEKENTSID
jgi:hypothetical protein